MSLQRLRRIVLLPLFAPCVALDAFGANHSTGAPPPSLVVYGDHTAAAAVLELKRLGFRVTSKPASSAATPCVVIVQEASEGALTLHRSMGRQVVRKRPHAIVWLLSGASRVHDDDLLELEAMEAVEIMGMEGADVPSNIIAIDQERGGPPLRGIGAKGWSEVAAYLRTCQLEAVRSKARRARRPP